MRKLLLITALIATTLTAEKVFPSWTEIHEKMTELCNQVDGDQVDVVVGITVGGLVPLTIASSELKNKNVTTISARSYEDNERKDLALGFLPRHEDIEGKRVLLVDEIVDSGRTIETVRNLLLTTFGAESVTVAALYVKEASAHLVDHYGEITDKWVVFPWEISPLSK